MECTFEGSVVVVWLEEHGDELCIWRFCSDSAARGTWRWNVYLKVLKYGVEKKVTETEPYKSGKVSLWNIRTHTNRTLWQRKGFIVKYSDSHQQNLMIAERFHCETFEFAPTEPYDSGKVSLCDIRTCTNRTLWQRKYFIVWYSDWHQQNLMIAKIYLCEKSEFSTYRTFV